MFVGQVSCAFRVLHEHHCAGGRADHADFDVWECLRQLRKNALPTADELKQWEEEGTLRPLGDADKESLRLKARKLVGEKGLPEGLRGLMGGQASREAACCLFDSLQDKEVARAIVTAMLTGILRGVCR